MAHPGGDRHDVAGVLADRLAATLVHHEPGWRLPRLSALARRYDVRPGQVEQAVRELAARHLIRQLPDGQIYRASPAEFLVPVHGLPELGAQVDPMGSDIVCRSRKASWRRVPEDIGLALGIAATGSICAVKCHWSLNGAPAAISTTYLTAEAAGAVGEAADANGGAPGEVLGAPADGSDPPLPLGIPAALHLEMQPPPSSVARGLRLGAGQPALLVTVRYDHPDTGQPVALMLAALRADLFRVVVDTTGTGVTAPGLPDAGVLADDAPAAGEAGPPYQSRPAIGS